MPATPEQVRAELKRIGLSVTGWARTNSFNPNLVFEVLADRKKGHYGQSHVIAVMLGLKEGEIDTSDKSRFKPPKPTQNNTN